VLVVKLSRKFVIRNDLIGRRGFDEVPVEGFTPRFFDQISSEEVKENNNDYLSSGE